MTSGADLVLLDGKIWTGWPATSGDRSSLGKEFAQAVAVAAGRIVAVGTDKEIQPYISARAERLDLRGALVLPGFIDSHVHLLEGGFQSLELDLRDTKDQAEFVQKIAARAAMLPPGQWLRGGYWDETLSLEGKLPTRSMVDPVTPYHPVFLRRADGHAALANSLALKLGGVTPATESPIGGEIVLDALRGEPTGVLKDRAQELITRVMPAHSETEALHAIKGALNEAAQCGVTSVHNMDLGSGPCGDLGSCALPLLCRARKEGWLTCRVYEIVPLPSWPQFVNGKALSPGSDDFVRLGGVKAFADGSLGSRTAWMDEPYADDPSNVGLRGELMGAAGQAESLAREADAGGWQLVFHAIGTRACHETLNLLERIGGGPCRTRRFRVEHAQHVRPSDFARFGRLGVIASMQPWHAMGDSRWAEERLGRARARYSYAWRSMLDAGAPLAFGSDWPIAPLNPLLGVYAAVTRATLDARHPRGWCEEQRITLREALWAYTAGSAFAEFAESEKGAIAPGKLADMVVLSDDLFSLPGERIKDARVLLTIIGGRVVYRADTMIGTRAPTR